MKIDNQISRTRDILYKIKDLSSTCFDLRPYLELQKNFFNEIGVQFEEEDKIVDSTFDPYYLAGSNYHALNTAIVDILRILAPLPNFSTIADIGSAHSLMSICSNLLDYNFEVISIEPIQERFTSALNINEVLGGKHTFVTTHFEDISNETRFDYAFLYLPSGNVIEKILQKLHDLSTPPKSILVIESHGDLIPRLDLHPSLTNKKVHCLLKFPRHDSNCYIYDFSPGALDSFNIFLKDLYSNQFVLVNQDSRGQWIASLKDVYVFFESTKNFIIECTYPPRTFKSSVNTFEKIKLMDIKRLDQRCTTLISNLEDNQKYDGKFLRKIYLDKTICELSDGSLAFI